MDNFLIWSDRAQEEYDKLQEYLYGEWGEEIAQRVIKEIAQTITRIQNSPEHFPFFDTRLVINQLSSITYGKQGRDFINNWIKVEFYGLDDELQDAYFADGNNRGWSGIFGGTRKIYNLLLNMYLVE